MSTDRPQQSWGARICLILGISAGIAINRVFLDLEGGAAIAAATALGAAGGGLGAFIGNLLFPSKAFQKDKTEDTFK